MDFLFGGIAALAAVAAWWVNNQSDTLLAKATLEKNQESAQSDLQAQYKVFDELVKPLKESLKRVEVKICGFEKERVASCSALNAQLKGLVETHLLGLRYEAVNIVKSTPQPIVSGRWGELQ